MFTKIITLINVVQLFMIVPMLLGHSNFLFENKINVWCVSVCVSLCIRVFVS